MNCNELYQHQNKLYKNIDPKKPPIKDILRIR